MQQSPVCRQEVVVALDDGLHLRPQSQIAKAALRYPCDITLAHGNQQVSAKSMLELMTLKAMKGDSLTIEARGEQADEAVAEIVQLFASNFAVVDH